MGVVNSCLGCGVQNPMQTDVEISEPPMTAKAGGETLQDCIYDIAIECSPQDAIHFDLKGMQMIVIGSNDDKDNSGSLKRTSQTTWEYSGVIRMSPDVDKLIFVIQSDGDGIGYLALTNGEVKKYATMASSTGMRDVGYELVMEANSPALLLKFAISGMIQDQEAPVKDINASQHSQMETILRGLTKSGAVFRLYNKMGRTQEEIFDWICEVLMNRFKQTGDLDDVSKAIEYQDRAITLTPEGHVDMPPRLHSLGISFRARFDWMGNPDDISRAIEYQHRAVALIPEGHANMPSWLNNLGNSLQIRFKRMGHLDDISKAIVYQNRAVALTPADHANMPCLLSNLGISLQSRFHRTGNLHDVSMAIEYQDCALALTPEGHADMPSWLNNLGNSLRSRFDHTGNVDDISRAIECQDRALALTPEGHADMPCLLSNLGVSFQSRFNRTGNLDDISRAIEYKHRAVAVAPEGHPEMPFWLGNLGNTIQRRFDRTGNIDDISRAIEYQHRALVLAPKDHDKMPSWLNNLGNSFQSRFDHMGDPEDISKALEYELRAVELTPENHVEMPSLLNHLAHSLCSRFGHTGNLDDICKAIEYQHRAVALISKGHANMPSMLNTLGILFRSRFDQTGHVDDISQAIDYQHRAVLLAPEGHTGMPTWRANIGLSLIKRYKQTSDLADCQAANLNFHLSATQLSGPPEIRLRAARQWAHSAFELDDKAQVLQAYAVAVELLSLVASMDQTIQSRHDNLAKISDLTPEAVLTAIVTKHLNTALEWLEQGRCLVWAQLNQLRTPIAKLREHDAELADHFLMVSKRLELSGSRPKEPSASEMAITHHMKIEDQARTHLKLAQEWDQLLHRIRTIPDFHDFLRPRKTSTILSQLPSNGPIVIINVHPERVDAMVLIHGADQVLHIPLNDTTYEKLEKLRRDLRDYLTLKKLLVRDGRAGRPSPRRDAVNIDVLQNTLHVLWKGIVKPILEGLRYSVTSPPRNRIWWCPTGPLTFLPIHAAGIYGRGDKTQGSCLSDYAISSYIPTVNTLLEKLRHPAKGRQPDTKILLVSQPNTPGLLRIPGTTTETKAIVHRMTEGGVGAVRLEGDEATTQRVKEGLRSHQWVHLACHASQNPADPLKSGFYLHDGQLELMNIIRQELPAAEFAFLSACQTGVGDERLTDEAVHLAAGMLAAGYQGVVGTMWSIGDDCAPKIAEEFYGHLLKERRDSGNHRLDSSRAAYALDHAIRKIRSELPDDERSLLTWVPYVHYGL